ncbi:MAG TPA: oxidoreductase, partial [Xanthobacteraceae bacterium]|nr:oxidoreductase [Xanthobacteraceae bacterium]
MAQVTKVIRNFYRDSVALMRLSAHLSALAGVRQASAVMASPNNLALLREAGLLAGDIAAGANDLLVALDGEDEAALAAALAEAERGLQSKPATGDGAGPRQQPPRSLEMGLETMPAANLALISTPGDYAAAEAFKALHLGLNVMLFSDNVPIADEVALKR